MIVFLFFFTLVVGSVVFWSWWNGISPMPTSPKVKKHLLHLLPASVEGTVYELGSGWGTLLFPLAQKYPDNVVVGLETSPVPFLISLLLSWCYRRKNLRLCYRDFFHKDLSDAGLIVCYLYPGAMVRLKSKLADLKKGTWVVSNTFAVPGWEPIEVVEVNDLYHTKIYFYRTIPTVSLRRSSRFEPCRKL